MIVPRHAAIAAVLAVLALALPPETPAAAHGHEAGPHAQPLTLDHGKKWATDAPLRKGMRAIRASLAAKLEAIHAGKLSPGEYRVLGETIEKRVGEVVAQCKLPPAADANLHVIVAGLAAAADAMQGKEAAVKPAMGAERAVRLVNQYRDYFDDPGLEALGTTSGHGAVPKTGARRAAA